MSRIGPILKGSHSKNKILASPVKKKASSETNFVAKTAIGVSKFKKLVENSTVFIDKSFLIKEFLDNPAEVLLITYPRRWGKSVNIDMIKTFLEIEVDEYGNKHSDKTLTNNYKLFQGNSCSGNLETLLNIVQDNDFKDKYDHYQGEYPVISIDFKNIKATSYQEIVDQVKLAINYAFKQHEFLIDVFDTIRKNRELSHLKIIKVEDYLNNFKRIYLNFGQEATTIDVQNSLKFLSEALHSHFGKKVFILMDEYDTPINNILENNNFSNNDLEKSLLLFKNLMNASFKGNEHLEKALVTGVFRIAKSSLFSNLNNLVEYNFLNNKFAKYYGFTENEVDDLFDAYKIGREEQLEAKKWYDGYRVSVDQSLKIFNPWSIVNFLHHKKIANYWEETGSIDFIKKLFKIEPIKTKIQTLLNSEDGRDQNSDSVKVKLEGLTFNQDEYILLKELLKIKDNYEVKNETVDLFLRYIFAAGYLTIAADQKYGLDTCVKLPNREVKIEMEKKLIFYYRQIYNIDSQLFINVTDELIKFFTNNDSNGLENSLEHLFNAFPKFVSLTADLSEKGVHGNEDLIHSVINYCALQIKSLFKFGTEVWYKKKGRADILLIDGKTKLGMIIELKYDGSADEALIKTHKYFPLFKGYNIQTIKSVGINVSPNKTVDIKFELHDQN